MQFIHEKIDKGYETLKREDGVTRRYMTPNGVAYPSVTTVTGILNADKIAAWRARVGEEEANKIGSKAATRGTAVHNLIEKYLLNDPEYGKGVLPHVMQSLVNIKPILEKRLNKIYELEVPLYSDHLKLAGTCDCACEFDGVNSIVDFKTSKWPKKKSLISNYFVQAAAYAIMWEERTGMPMPNLVIVMDVDGGRPLTYKEHRDNWTDKLNETIDLYNKQQNERALFG
jgi:genome maintenance exonuclease 1